MSDVMRDTWIINLAKCPRCGETHAKLRASSLTNPPADLWNAWATCPTTGQPVWFGGRRHDSSLENPIDVEVVENTGTAELVLDEADIKGHRSEVEWRIRFMKLESFAVAEPVSVEPVSVPAQEGGTP